MSKITEAHDIRIEEFLNYPELKIPMFQRDYVWSAEEIEEFWSDLTEEGIEFLGSIILKDEEYSHNTRTGYLEIVDGQQRTISILLLLKTISRRLLILARARKSTYEINAEKQAEDINRLISRRDREDLTKILSYKLTLPNENDNKVFWDILDGNLSSNQKLYRNFFAVQKKLESLFDSFLLDIKSNEKKINQLIKLKNSILDIKIIQVIVPTDEDAYMIFEAVNDRGADLGAAELLKNHLFAHIKNNQNDIQEEWQKIKRTLSSINRRSIDLTGFLRYYWISKYDHLSKRTLFKGIKNRMSLKSTKDRVSPDIILSEISAYREALEKIFSYGLDEWRALFGTSNSDADIRQIERRAHEWFSYKKNLNYFPKSIQYLPIYTAIIGNLNKIAIPQRPFVDLLLSIERINFLYSYLLQEPTNKIDKMLSGIGRDILSKIESGKNDEIIKSVQKGTNIINKFIKDNVKKRDIDDAINSLNWNKPADKSIIYFILINLEYSLGGYSRLLVQDDLTLEHIYPKSVEKKGKIKGWPNLDFDYTKIGHGIGNITLLPSSGPQANGSAGEESYKIKKRDYLLPSSYSINRYFQKIDNWKGKNIKDRLKYIQNQVWKRWGVN